MGIPESTLPVVGGVNVQVVIKLKYSIILDNDNDSVIEAVSATTAATVQRRFTALHAALPQATDSWIRRGDIHSCRRDMVKVLPPIPILGTHMCGRHRRTLSMDDRSVAVRFVCVWAAALEQSAKRPTEVCILPCINDGVHHRVGHGQGEYRFVKNGRAVAQHFENLSAGNYKVWHPTHRKTANNQKHYLK
jgi:hypothetical protein